MVQYKGSHLSPRYRPLTGVPWQTLTAQAEPNDLFDPLHPLLGTAGLAPQPTAWCHLCPLRLFSVQAATGIFFFLLWEPGSSLFCLHSQNSPRSPSPPSANTTPFADFLTWTEVINSDVLTDFLKSQEDSGGDIQPFAPIPYWELEDQYLWSVDYSCSQEAGPGGQEQHVVQLEPLQLLAVSLIWSPHCCNTR